MIYLLSTIVVLALFGGAVTIIWSTLSEHADAIVAALAGKSLRSASVAAPLRSVRVSVRQPLCRPVVYRPLRAAA